MSNDSGIKARLLFWKFWFCRRGWCHEQFGFHYVPDQIDGIMYCGVTLFGYSLIYSDVWV